MVLSFCAPSSLNRINPVVAVESRQSIRKFPTGDARKPERLMACVKLDPPVAAWAVAIMEVPSHSLQNILAATAVSTTVTVPDANQVPDEPCATVGPVK